MGERVKNVVTVLITGLIIGLTVFPTVTCAHMLTTPTLCSAPVKPYKLTDKYEIDKYKMQVEKFKECITDFIEEQKQAVAKHNATINSAIDEWNLFVSRQ